MSSTDNYALVHLTNHPTNPLAEGGGLLLGMTQFPEKYHHEYALHHPAKQCAKHISRRRVCRPIWRSFGVYVKNAVYTTLGNTMPLALSLILGAGYYIALAAIAIYTATLRLWLPYIAGSITFLFALTIGGNWAASGEDGPSGFAVVAAHGLIFWVAAIAHIIRWLRTLLL